MCDPVSAVIGAISVASTIGGQVAANKSAKAQVKAIHNQRALVREETRRTATNELFDQMRDMRRQQGRIRSSAGEAGLGLTSGAVEGLLFDTAMQMELQGDRTLANMESRHTANESEAASMLSRIQKPTALGAGLQIAAAGASAWSGAEAAKIAKTNAAANAARAANGG